MLINLLSFLHFLNDGFVSSILIIFPFIAKDLKLTMFQVGFLTSLIDVVAIFFVLPSAHVVEKIGRIKFFMISIFLYASGFFLIGFSQDFFIVAFFVFIAGLGFAGFHPISFAQITHLADKKNRGQIMGQYTAIGELGKAIISTLVAIIIPLIGWRLTSSIFGALAFSSFFFLFWLITKKIKKDQIIYIPPVNKKINFINILKNKHFILVIFINIFDNMASSALFVFLPFLLFQKGINPAFLAAFTGAFLFGNLSGKIILGRLIDRFKSSVVFIVCEFFMALAIIILTISSSVVSIILSSIFLGILTKGTVPIRMAMIAEANEHHDNFERAYSIGTIFSEIAITITPLILGRIADLYGIQASFYTTAIFAVLAILPAIFYSLSPPGIDKKITSF